MKILVANLGSTSFKYHLFEERDGSLVSLASGGFERVADYEKAIQESLEFLQSKGFIQSPGEITAVGFKTVLGYALTGCTEADDSVVADLRKAAPLAPAHNPAYADGIECFAKLVPGAVRVALYESAFYQWALPASRHYAVPSSWHDAGVKRHGFHGASHKYIAERSAELMDRPDVARRVRHLYHEGPGTLSDDRSLRVVSCHLGGSSSITGISNGLAIDSSMGMSPQSGLPQNNRVGELDAMAVPYMMRKKGLDLDTVDKILTRESGLLGLSGLSNDVRDLQEAVDRGDDRARLALDYLVYQVRHYIGAYMFQMGGLDVLVFTGGIGEKGTLIRNSICIGLEDLGIQLDEDLNNQAVGGEACISQADSRIKVWIIPANEELVVARETARFVANKLK